MPLGKICPGCSGIYTGSSCPRGCRPGGKRMTPRRRRLEVGQRMPSAAGIAAPPGDYTSWDEYMLDIEQLADREIDREAQRGLKAMRLAPSLTVCRALLAGQPVPRSALDPDWRSRYGL